MGVRSGSAIRSAAMRRSVSAYSPRRVSSSARVFHGHISFMRPSSARRIRISPARTSAVCKGVMGVGLQVGLRLL